MGLGFAEFLWIWVLGFAEFLWTWQGEAGSFLGLEGGLKGKENGYPGRHMSAPFSYQEAQTSNNISVPPDEPLPAIFNAREQVFTTCPPPDWSSHP